MRFSNSGNSVSTVLTTAMGYAQPTIAANSSSAWIVMLGRTTTARTVVSRRFNGSSWGSDVVEVPATTTNGGDYAWPNAVRDVDHNLRFIIDGKRCPTTSSSNAVLYHQRAVWGGYGGRSQRSPRPLKRRRRDRAPDAGNRTVVRGAADPA